MLSKFGMSFKYITPNMVQYMILSHVVFLYAFAVFSFGFPILCCGDDDDDDDDDDDFNVNVTYKQTFLNFMLLSS